mmetsp:Transcript_46215/g.112899  ORF Transcript_46215/g.112899 Transcript_46215/m.112899 type:complete len:90 (+) Transcript_46215:126-395(+)
MIHTLASPTGPIVGSYPVMGRFRNIICTPFVTKSCRLKDREDTFGKTCATDWEYDSRAKIGTGLLIFVFYMIGAPLVTTKCSQKTFAPP